MGGTGQSCEIIVLVTPIPQDGMYNRSEITLTYITPGYNFPLTLPSLIILDQHREYQSKFVPLVSFCFSSDKNTGALLAERLA